MKPIAIVTCAACAVGLWSCAAVASDAGRRRSRAVELPSLDEMVRVVEAQRYLTSAASDLIGSVTSGKVFDFYGFSAGYDDPTVAGRGKKPKPAMMAMAMAGTAVMSMMLMKSMGAIMMFIVHSFFATKLGLIVAAYLLLCKLAEMNKAPAKSVIKWSSSPPASSSYDKHPPPMPQMMLAGGGGPYPDSEQSSYAADPLQQQDLFQQQPPQQQQPSDQYGVPQQQYSAPADFGGGGGGGGGGGFGGGGGGGGFGGGGGGGGGGFGGGDFMQAHYSNVSPVTYRPPINKSVAENVAKSTAAKSTATAGRL